MSEEGPGSGEEGQSEEDHPPWVAPLLDADADFFDEVMVLEEKADKAQPGWVRCKEIIVSDAADAASGKPTSEVRRYRLRKHSTIMIISGPLDPPYLGLVEKLWRKADAQPVRSTNIFRLADFGVECYWFYRPQEVPREAWQTMPQPSVSGAKYRFPEQHKGKPAVEKCSERQLLFSSHHTRHDYPDDHGVLSMEMFLQTCEVHWLGHKSEHPLRYSIHGSRLVCTREPGFYVQGFLWCNSKKHEQFNAAAKRAYPLDSTWGDDATQDIVRHMLKKYAKRSSRIRGRNAAVIAKFKAARAAGQATIESDDGDDAGGHHTPSGSQDQAGDGGGSAAAAAAAAAGDGAARRRPPPSPRLPGLHPGDDGGGGALAWPAGCKEEDDD